MIEIRVSSQRLALVSKKRAAILAYTGSAFETLGLYHLRDGAGRLSKRPTHGFEAHRWVGGGRPHEWSYDELRPWLEAKFGRQLPSTLPAQRGFFRP